MRETATVETTPKTDAEYEAAIDQYLAEMRRIREQMMEDQREIERLRAETRALLAAWKTA